MVEKCSKVKPRDVCQEGTSLCREISQETTLCELEGWEVNLKIDSLQIFGSTRKNASGMGMRYLVCTA